MAVDKRTSFNVDHVTALYVINWAKKNFIQYLKDNRHIHDSEFWAYQFGMKIPFAVSDIKVSYEYVKSLKWWERIINDINPFRKFYGTPYYVVHHNNKSKKCADEINVMEYLILYGDLRDANGAKLEFNNSYILRKPVCVIELSSGITINLVFNSIDEVIAYQQHIEALIDNKTENSRIITLDEIPNLESYSIK